FGDLRRRGRDDLAGSGAGYSAGSGDSRGRRRLWIVIGPGLRLALCVRISERRERRILDWQLAHGDASLLDAGAAVHPALDEMLLVGDLVEERPALGHQRPDGFERVRVIGRLERYGADNAVDLDLENLLKIPRRPCRARIDAEIEHGQIESRRKLITTNDGPIILAINGLDFIIIDIAHGSPRLAVLLAPCIIDPLDHALHRGAAGVMFIVAPAAFPFQGLGKAGAEFLVAHARPAAI